MVQQIFREHGGIDVFSVFDRGWFDKYISESIVIKSLIQFWTLQQNQLDRQGEVTDATVGGSLFK